MNKLHLSAIVFVFLILTGNGIKCQEKIVDLKAGSDISLVRHIDDHRAIIYNNYYSKYNTFSLFEFGTPNIYQIMYIDDLNLLVNDFEIFDNVVYFCGITNRNNPHAMFGYFQITSSFDGDIYIDSVPQLTMFKKLDVFSVGEEVHVVMTASTRSYTDAFVDVRYVTTNSWQYTVATVNDYNLTFDDVAVTDTTVVFTSHAFIDNYFHQYMYGFTDIHYFPKPPAAGMSLFYNTSNNDFGRLYNKPTGSVLISRKHGDDFDLATPSEWFHVSVDNFYGTSYNQSARINKDASDIVEDIRHNHSYTHTWVDVVTPISATGGYSTIWFLNTVAIPPATMTYKTTSPVIINSIDNMQHYIKCVGVGHDYSSQSHFLYLLDYGTETGCVPTENMKQITDKYLYIPDKQDIVLAAYYHEFRKLTYNVITMNLNNTCEQR